MISANNEGTEKPLVNNKQLEEEKSVLQNLKIQAGWIMMEQLLSFDIHWVSSKLKILFGLWQQQFSYQNYEKLPIDEQINQMKISIPCLKTLRSFLRKCKNLQTEHVLKLVGSYLLNYYNAIFAEGEKEKLKSNEKYFNEYNLAKIVKIIYFFHYSFFTGIFPLHMFNFS